MYYCLTELCVCLARAQEAHSQENQSMFQGYLWVKLYYIVDMELETQRPGTTTTLKSTAQVSVCGVTKKQLGRPHRPSSSLSDDQIYI